MASFALRGHVDVQYRGPQQPYRACKPQPARGESQVVGGAKSKRKNKTQGFHQRSGPCTHFDLLPDGSDVWRIDPVRDMLETGAVRLHNRHRCPLCSNGGVSREADWHADWHHTNGRVPSAGM